MNQVFIHNAKIVLVDKIVHGNVLIEDGIIKKIDQDDTHYKGNPLSINFNGDYLIAGLIELHTDNMEKHFVPRPGVKWPGQSAVLTHDAQMISAGITTVFDAVSLGDVNEGGMRLDNLKRMLESITAAQNEKLTRAEHYIHLRCELSHENCESLYNEFVNDDNVKLVSLMDHSPGQRQFANVDKYRQYYQGKYKLSDKQMNDFIVTHTENSKLYSSKARDNIAKSASQKQLVLASHDDATLEHVEESIKYNLSIAEFPTTVVAAKASHKKNMSVLMGAPNVVRGGSHSGNVSASELADLGVLDILSSDYYPHSLLDAVFNLAFSDNDFDLVSAAKLANYNPAKIMNFQDRGEIKVGKRADLVQVRNHNNFPLIKKVFASGERVF